MHLTLRNHTTAAAATTTILCTATSVIHVACPRCIALIEDGSVGLGQLFRYLNKLPTFSLVDAGRLRIMKKGGGGGGGGGVRPRTSGRMSASNWSGAGEAEAAKDQDEFGEEEEEEECREIEEGGGEGRGDVEDIQVAMRADDVSYT